jgi:Uma2 family endonuclease
MSTTPPVALPASRFPETDGVPLETPWHRDQINFLVNLTRFHFRERDDFYTGGNMFIYYDPQDPRKNAGPDYFYVTGVDRHKPRRIWAIWEEGERYPDTIVELMSPTTKHKDRRTNKAIYETVFRTPEYFLFDPDTQELQGWRLVEGIYEPIEPDERGWLWSEQLGLWLDAQHVLADDLDRNSTNAQAYKLVARAASAHETWGGTFTDGGLRQPAALFNFSQKPLISSIDASMPVPRSWSTNRRERLMEFGRSSLHDAARIQPDNVHGDTHLPKVFLDHRSAPLADRVSLLRQKGHANRTSLRVGQGRSENALKASCRRSRSHSANASCVVS